MKTRCSFFRGFITRATRALDECFIGRHRTLAFWPGTHEATLRYQQTNPVLGMFRSLSLSPSLSGHPVLETRKRDWNELLIDYLNKFQIPRIPEACTSYQHLKRSFPCQVATWFWHLQPPDSLPHLRSETSISLEVSSRTLPTQKYLKLKSSYMQWTQILAHLASHGWRWATENRLDGLSRCWMMLKCALPIG